MTIHDIAKLAGVSVGTVSNVLNNSGKVAFETRKRILKIIEEVDYVPNRIARSMKSVNTRNILILSEDIQAFPSPYIIDGICEYCYDHDYNITLLNLRINPMIHNFRYDEYLHDKKFQKDLLTAIQQAKAMSVSGIIYVSIYPRDIENILPELDIPVTFCYSYSHGDNYCVNCNDYDGAKTATDYLISLGHKKIALACGVFDSLPTHKRLQGYQTALMEHELPFIPQYVIPGINWDDTDGYNACQQLMELPDPPTAIFAMSDVIALGVIRAAKEKKLNIPEDLSVHGYDNIEYSNLCIPRLTTIAMPLHEIGRKSAELEINLIEKQSPKEHKILLNCKHIIRDSVSSPN